jgi:RNA-directed DNA polymerase
VKQGPEQRPTPPRSVVSENSWGAEVSHTERQSEGAETNRGSLSRCVVPIETGETDSREPGSREGGGRVVEASSETRVGPVPMESVSTRRRRIEMAAQRHPNEPLTALNQHMDLNWMHEAYRRVRKDSAPGIDGQTVAEYGESLTEHLRDLLARAKSGRYQAPPVKRAYVPKNEKENRPIGLPTTEDKILQRAVVMLLEPIYELEFLPFSFGFRPGRSPHQALEYLREQCHAQKVEWVLEVDLRKFFDTVGHGHIRELLGRRVQDGVITRLIGKWLKAGVWEDGKVSHPQEGTPQGGVVSPIISNIYLHEVLDKWFIESVQPRCRGHTFMVRFADDFIMGFERLEDAQKVMRVIDKRFARFGLKINAEKTRLVPFKRPPFVGGNPQSSPGTFDFLGFTLYWGKTRKGYNVVMPKTARKRFTRTLEAIKQWCRTNRHLSLKEQQSAINAKLCGHDAYYGITFNSGMLSKLRLEVERVWLYWLNRRNRGRRRNWQQFKALLTALPLAPARIVHSYL